MNQFIRFSESSHVALTLEEKLGFKISGRSPYSMVIQCIPRRRKAYLAKITDTDNEFVVHIRWHISWSFISFWSQNLSRNWHQCWGAEARSSDSCYCQWLTVYDSVAVRSACWSSSILVMEAFIILFSMLFEVCEMRFFVSGSSQFTP